MRCGSFPAHNSLGVSFEAVNKYVLQARIWLDEMEPAVSRRSYAAAVSVPPPTSGQLSPDGKWWWDGQKWSPSQAPIQALAPAYPPAVNVYGPRSNSYAVASLVTRILSWFLCPVLGAIVAVALGHIARGQIRRTGEGGSGLAMTGLILGYAHLAFFGIFILFWLVVFGGMAALLGRVGSIPIASPTP